jgi:hypothetical protein
LELEPLPLDLELDPLLLLEELELAVKTVEAMKINKMILAKNWLNWKILRRKTACRG